MTPKQDKQYGVFSHRPGILVQRDISMMEYSSVAAALADPGFDFPNPEDTAMLISNRGQMFELNLPGALVWEAMDGARTVDDFVALVVENFDIEASIGRRDIEHLIADLERCGLIQPAKN